jgi:hypothetical protein
VTMTDDQGASIPAGTVRDVQADLAQIEEVRTACQKMADVLTANGIDVSPLLLMGAKVDALMALLGPDPTTPVRLAFDLDVARRTATALQSRIVAAQEEKRGPALVVASSVPEDLRLEFRAPNGG